MLLKYEFVDSPYWDAFLKELIYFFGFMMLAQFLSLTCLRGASKVDSMHTVALNAFKIESKVKQKTEDDWNLKLDKQIVRRRAYFGIPIDILPSVLKYTCGTSIFGATKENIADFWFYVFNNHSFFSLFLASASARIPNLNRRLNFVFVGVFSFTCYAIIADIPSHYKYAVCYCVLMPLQYLIDGIFHRVLNMGCINCLKRHICTCILGYAIQFAIRIFAVLFIFNCMFISAYILADKVNLLFDFFLEYHTISLVVEILVISRKFWKPKWYAPDTLCCCITTGVGSWYRQKHKYAQESQHGTNTVVAVNPLNERSLSVGSGVQMKSVV